MANGKDFFSIVEGKEPILEWVKRHVKDGKLSMNDELNMPYEDVFFAKTKLKGVSIAPGMAEYSVGGWDDEESKAIADDLARLFHELEEPYNERDDERALSKIGEIYELLTKQPFSQIWGKFVRNLDLSQRQFVGMIINIGILFMRRGVHKEPVKFGVLMTGEIPKKDEILEMVRTLGLVSDIARYAGMSLEGTYQSDEVFALAKATEGYARFFYLDCLENIDNDMKSWLIYEAYKSNKLMELLAYEYVTKGNLLWHIKNGWNEVLYDATGELICGLFDDRHDRIYDIEDAGEILTRYAAQSANETMNIDRLYVLCAIDDFAKENGEKVGLGDEEIKQISDRVFEAFDNPRYDWKSMVLPCLENYRARKIADELGLDLWEEVFAIATRTPNGEQVPDWCWWELAKTDDVDKFGAVCELAEVKMDLAKIGRGVGDLLFSDQNDESFELETLIAKMADFRRVINARLINTALNSPVVRLRNAALRVIDTWNDVPGEILETLRANRNLEPDDIRSKYDEILLNLKASAQRKTN